MPPSLDSLATALTQIEALAFQKFDREISEKHLCYHNHHHIKAVQARAQLIFKALRPYVEDKSAIELDRMEHLLDFCAATHDLIQLFLPQTAPHSSRRRESGISETDTLATLSQLIAAHCPNALTEADLEVIKVAIEATICDYDPSENSIFQPALYRQVEPIGWVARILALADIGSLGIEGIAAYNAEGSLLFLEENPDVLELVRRQEMPVLSASPDLYENIRQRLLKRARFQVDFAKSRYRRLPQELAGFPPVGAAALAQQVFQHLNTPTIETIVQTTPTAADTPLESLLHFFNFEQQMKQDAMPGVIQDSVNTLSLAQ
jgi:hypothetical protein